MLICCKITVRLEKNVVMPQSKSKEGQKQAQDKLDDIVEVVVEVEVELGNMSNLC